MIFLAAALVLPQVACVIPPPFEDERDASSNHTPVIQNANPPMPGNGSLEPGSTEIYTVFIEDKDRGDTLYVRVFRDYDPDLSPFVITERIVLNDPDTGPVVRTVDLLTNTWCAGAELDVPHVFDVMVADRPFADSSVPPPNRAVTEGGDSSVRSWVITCSMM